MLNVRLDRSTADTFGKLFDNSELNWQALCAEFLEAVSPNQRVSVRRVLDTVHHGGSGLRDWVSSIAYRGAVLPARVPEQVIDVYLADSEAVPLHDCEECGLAVPVRPNRLHGMESEPEQRYFHKCPICNGRTGPYYFWSKQSAAAVATRLRRKKPR